jgi:beta-catenin-like protein 1
MYASEILAILLQGSSVNQKRLGQANAIDALLQAVSETIELWFLSF